MGKLEDEYCVRLRAADPREPEAPSWVWLWYAKARYAADELPTIFELCQREPKAACARNAMDYIKEKLTEREFFAAMRSETGDAYAANLFAAGVIPTDVTSDPAFQELTQKVALEGIKAHRPLRGCDLTAFDECVAAGMIVIWLRFVDLFHELIVKPRVCDLLEVMLPQSTEEKELLEADDFAAYELTDKERDALVKDLGLIVVAAPRVP